MTTLTSQQMQIGNGGTGTFNQTGGTATFNSGGANWFALGGSANGSSGGTGTGTYNLSGGIVNMNSWLFIGADGGTTPADQYGDVQCLRRINGRELGMDQCRQ